MDVDKHQILEDFLQNLEFKHKSFDMSDMILRDDSPHPLEYCRTYGHTENTHDGQMKLLLADEMSIMLGLLHICEKSHTTLQGLGFGRLEREAAKVAVVVAGAAPGDHFADLRNTFRFVDFHLYDPAPIGWCRSLQDSRKRRNVTLYKQYFTVKTAEEWQDKKQKRYEHVIFLCDLRTNTGNQRFPSLDDVSADMKNQKYITKTINACYSVLKFCPRYYDDTNPHAEDFLTLKYFDGTIFLQGYPTKTSTETRLHVTDTESEKEYDTLVYEKQLFNHNQVTRNEEKILFGPDNLSYDDAYARFVEKFLERHLGERHYNQRQFEHKRVRALLEEFRLLLIE